MKIELAYDGAARKRLLERLDKLPEWQLARWLDGWLYGYGEGQPKCSTREAQTAVEIKLRNIMDLLERVAYEKAV